MVWRTTFAVDDNHPTSYLMAIEMFVQSLTVYEIFANQGNFQNIDLENEVQGHGVEKRDLRHSTRNVRIDKWFFS